MAIITPLALINAIRWGAAWGYAPTRKEAIAMSGHLTRGCYGYIWIDYRNAQEEYETPWLSVTTPEKLSGRYAPAPEVFEYTLPYLQELTEHWNSLLQCEVHVKDQRIIIVLPIRPDTWSEHVYAYLCLARIAWEKTPSWPVQETPPSFKEVNLYILNHFRKSERKAYSFIQMGHHLAMFTTKLSMKLRLTNEMYVDFIWDAFHTGLFQPKQNAQSVRIPIVGKTLYWFIMEHLAEEADIKINRFDPFDEGEQV